MEKILIVEDEEKIARFLELELQHEGYGVEKAVNGREGLDKVAGLDGGADDYMTKPFALEELLARIRLALKKRKGVSTVQAENQLSCRGLTMDIQRYEVTYAGNKIELTHREFELLKVLLENRNIVISRDTLLEKVCGYDYLGDVTQAQFRCLRGRLRLLRESLI